MLIASRFCLLIVKGKGRAELGARPSVTQVTSYPVICLCWVDLTLGVVFPVYIVRGYEDDACYWLQLLCPTHIHVFLLDLKMICAIGIQWTACVPPSLILQHIFNYLRKLLRASLRTSLPTFPLPNYHIKQFLQAPIFSPYCSLHKFYFPPKISYSISCLGLPRVSKHMTSGNILWLINFMA